MSKMIITHHEEDNRWSVECEQLNVASACDMCDNLKQYSSQFCNESGMYLGGVDFRKVRDIAREYGGTNITVKLIA